MGAGARGARRAKNEAEIASDPPREYHDKMVLAAHVIFSVYGFWLPNDPRGSWSDFVGAWELLRFGKATKVKTHRSAAHVSHDRQARRAAKAVLQYPPVLFAGAQARAVGQGFGRAIAQGGYLVHACSILPDHVHLVIASHLRPFEQITAHLKANATRCLRESALHTLAGYTKPGGNNPSPWSHGLWKIYADSEQDVIRMIHYVERNPEKEEKPRQFWSFVTSLAR